MNNIYIVSKSSDDASLLRRMLPPAIRGAIDFVVADEDPVSVISTARTLLALEGQPVGLVVDACTTDATLIASKRQTIEALLSGAAANAPWKLFIAVPDLPTVWADRVAVNQIPLAQEIITFVKNHIGRPNPALGADSIPHRFKTATGK
jgi:hypothetical protein